MKNITDELCQRLATVQEERDRLSHRLEELQDVEKAIDLLIKNEESRTKTSQLPLLSVSNGNGKSIVGKTDYSRFIFQVLADGKPRALKELVAIAKKENISFQKKSPGRVLHYTLVGLSRNNYTRKTGAGIWQLTEIAINKGK